MSMYQTHILKNGLKVIHQQVDGKAAWCGLIIGVGSRDERPEEEGIAHFIEHVIFKGTEKRKAFHILSRIEDVGGELNAYTTKEDTCIYASFLARDYERALELFADIVFHSVFPEKEIEKEKDKKEKRSKCVFTPPTLEEVQAYCRERGNRIDPQYFLDYYTSTGWMRGKVKLKDWKAAVRTWERQDAKWQGQTDDRQQGASAPRAAAPAENNALAKRLGR